jgi:glycosyltransferase involved in cell wall biosynthesis
MSRDIIFFSGIEWYGQNRMPCHHLVEGLAKQHRVFYINNFGALRDLDYNDLSRCVSKVLGLLRGCKNPHIRVEDSCDDVHVCQPWVIPTPRLSLIQTVNVALLRRSLKKLYEEHDIQAPIIWARLSTPIVWEAIQGMERSLLVYQSIDKFPEHPRIAKSLRKRYRATEQKFNKGADVVFTSARGLYDEKRVFNPNTNFIPNGVGEAFADSPLIKISTMEAISGPVVGFAGALGKATDIEWIVRLATGMPAVTFVFLGTIDRTEPLLELETLKNVILAGLVPHHELISWFQYFDIGLMPYKINAFQDYTFPSKLAEYLMGGLPIVATRLPELRHYSGVVKTADQPEAMMADIQELLDSGARTNSELIKQRKAVAATLTWEAQIVKIEEALAKALV